MPYLLPGDLNTHIYDEIREEITRNNEDLVAKAIESAVSEAKSYLSKYDLEKLFADPAVPDDENLRNKVKDLACWHLIKLSNPNIDLKLFRTAYEDAVSWFMKVTKGTIDPAGWPYKSSLDETTGFPEGGSVTYSSNTKRNNHY